MKASLIGAVCVLAAAIAGPSAAETKSVTWTGWFSNLSCAAARAKSGTFTETNPDCAKRSIEHGEAAVFISEQAKALFQVKDYAGLIDDLGYHLEVTANVDDAAGTISIRSVKRLEYQGASCSRPKKAAAKK